MVIPLQNTITRLYLVNHSLANRFDRHSLNFLATNTSTSSQLVHTGPLKIRFRRSLPTYQALSGHILNPMLSPSDYAILSGRHLQ